MLKQHHVTFFYFQLKVTTAESGPEEPPVPSSSGYQAKLNTAVAAKEALSNSGEFPDPPADWLQWLVDVKALAGPTVETYSHEVSYFMGFVERITKQPGRIDEAWNLNLVTRFVKELKSLYCPSTITNYMSALASVREFLKREGRKPKNYEDLQEQFRTMTKAVSKAKRSFVQNEKRVKAMENATLLRDFYQQIYHGRGLWKKYNDLVSQVKSAVESGEEVKRLKQKEFVFATSFALCLLLASNYKRSGNMALLDVDKTSEALHNAFSAFRKKNPSVHVSEIPRKFDATLSVPAVFEVLHSSKKGEMEFFCVLNPRDQKALLEYVEYLRPNGPVKPQANSLFLTARGKSLADQVTFYVHWIGNCVGLPNLKISALRSVVETANFLGLTDEAKEVSDALGHNINTALEFYVVPGLEHVVRASLRMLKIMEKEGERQWQENPKTLWDPVSLTVKWRRKHYGPE